MTSVFAENGVLTACTVIETGPCHITQVRTEETDGYSALQLAFGEKKEKNTSNALAGHFASSGSSPKKKLIEFRDFELDYLLVPGSEDENATVPEKKAGDLLTVDEVFQEGDVVNVVGRSKGKGFQGVVKRYNFKGVGDATHGQHNRQRAPGAIGNASTPSKVYKGMRMAGRTGQDRVKTKNLTVVKVMPEKNLLLVSGGVPGSKGSYLIIEKY